jgi:hypothetical protein
LSLAVPVTAAAQTAFVHPGILSTADDLNRMKTMVAARVEPYLAGWNRLRTDSHAQVGYTPHPTAIVQRIPDTVSYQALNSDAVAAHLNAIEWTVTGDAAYARKAVEILNGWSSTLTTFPSGGDPVLTAGLTGYQLAVAAEIVRATYTEWSLADQDRLKTLLLTKFYPIFHNFLIFHEPDGLPHTNMGVNQHFFTSWDAIAMVSMAAIGVFADDRAKYLEALDAFKNGTGNGNIMRAVFDGDTGQLMESGRDPEHAQLGIGLLATLCEIAWNQGDDLYGYANNRLLTGYEYMARYLLGMDVPFRTYTDPFRTYTVISTEFTADQIAGTRARPRPIYEMVWNHYMNRRGVPAPFTKLVAERIRPEGASADHIGFGTLLFTREAVVGGTGSDGGVDSGSSGGSDAGPGGQMGTVGTGGRVGTIGTGGQVGTVGTGGQIGTVGSGGSAGPIPTGGTTGVGPGASSTDVSSGCACRLLDDEGSPDLAGQLGLLALLGMAVAVSRSRRRRGG